MKRQYFEEILVNGEHLSKETIDEIMRMNGEDIENAKKPFGDYDLVKDQLSKAQETITALQKDGASLEEAQRAAGEWEQKYNKAVEDHKTEMADRDFHDILTAAITKAHGKNPKTIIPLLDLEALKASEKQAEDIEAALTAISKDNGYLFDDGSTPPPFSHSSGSNGGGGDKPMTLSSALHERYKG